MYAFLHHLTPLIRFTFLVGLLLTLSKGYSQVLINEVCSANETVLIDEDGEYPDWIELYNAGTQPIALGGYYLSDDDGEPEKWTFPNLIIAPGEYLLVFASGEDKLDQYAHTNFKIAKEGEFLSLANPGGNLIDFLQVPALEEDQSYGRQPDGTDFWWFFAVPSPAFTNNNQTGINPASPPTYTATQFFWNTPTTADLQCTEPGCEIRFTKDGSIPNENSTLYTAPITLDTTTTLRAVTFAPGFSPSAISTRSFFIEESHELPVVSLATAPENLWDPIDGIFVLGPDGEESYPYYGANFWKDITIPMHLEYFDEQKNLEVEYDLAAKVHGGRSSRTRPMKSLRFLAKADYGTAIMEYPFFKNKDIQFFERLVLRNASGDYNICHLRDPFLSRYFIDEGLNLDAIAYQPVTVYLNGVYWGVMGLREKVDKFYLEYNHGVDPDNVDILEEDTLIIEGNYTIFDQMEAFVMENDMRNDGAFAVADSFFDVKNLAEYFAVQTIVNNTDWPQNNLKYWRERKEGAKWRYIIFDMDAAMSRGSWTEADRDSWARVMERTEIRHVRLFRQLLDNESFRFYFLNRYADLLNTSFRTDRWSAEVQRSKDMIDSEMVRHLPRWEADYERWDTRETPKLFTFAEERPAYARQYLVDYFNLSHQVTLQLNTYPEGAGKIHINTITADQLPWQGIYFNAIPVELRIEANPGYTFSHWETTAGEKISGTTIQKYFSEDETIHAVFEHTTSAGDLELYPNPAQNEIWLTFHLPQLEDVQISVYNARGQLVLPRWKSTGLTGKNQLMLPITELDSGIFFVEVKGEAFTATRRFVRF